MLLSIGGPWLECSCSGVFSRAALGRILLLCAGGTTARGCGWVAENDGRWLAAARVGLCHRLRIPRAKRVHGADARAFALPYASAPRIGLAALPRTGTGQGSGVLNSCSFLGGTIGVTCGGIVFALVGFSGVLALVVISALLGAGLSLRLRVG
jgi:hypothetical protein